MEINSANQGVSSTSKSSLVGISSNEDQSVKGDIGLSLSMLGHLLVGLAGLVTIIILGDLPESGLEVVLEDLAESGLLKDLPESGLEVGLANSMYIY